MCWNGEASATLAVFGLASTAYVAIKGEAKALWIPLAYFSFMEILQALTYPVIDQCGLSVNQVLTLLGGLHITFQPFFINAASMHFIPTKIRDKISPFVYGICFIGAILILISFYPIAGLGQCNIGYEPFCGDQLCSVSGNWHIAWQAPRNGISWLDLGYYLPAFLLPIIYGAWKFTLYHIVTGPVFAALLTNNINEWPAIWCLFSIALLLLVIVTPIRKVLYTKWWWFWHSEENNLMIKDTSSQNSTNLQSAE